MDINRNNYEIFAIDFVEGKLSLNDSAEFLAFLADNPDIANEIELLRENTVALAEDKNTIDFSFLKKDLNSIPVSHKNFEEMCIAFHEDDLDEKAKNQLLFFINQHPELKDVFNAYEQLRLVPDMNVVYPYKSRLKQRKIALWPNWRIVVGFVSAAASIALFLILNNLKKGVPFIDTLDDAIAAIEIPIEESKDIVPIVAESKTQKHSNKLKREIKKEPVDFLEEKLAVIDTAHPEEERFIRITRIEPTPLTNNNLIAELSVKAPEISTPLKTQEENTVSSFKQKGNQLFTKASNLTLTDIIQTGIKGINQMAETDLKYETTTDKNGKVTEFALSSETFNIRRKTKRN